MNRKFISGAEQDEPEDMTGALFEMFYRKYPRHRDAAFAEKTWRKKIKVTDIEDIFKALEWQKKSDDWIKDNGQYIPYPASYLNGKRWLDTPERGTVEKLRNPETIEENYVSFICLEFGANLFETKAADLLQWFRNNERSISAIKTACPDMDEGITVLRNSKKEYKDKGFPWISDKVAKNFAFIMQNYESKHYKRSNK
jgi:hypothetical protein